MFGTAPHLVLGMVIPHMTLLACPRVLGLFFGKGVTSMTFITGVDPVAVAFIKQFLFLGLCLDTHVVTAAASLAPFHQQIRLHMGDRKSVQ